MKKSIHEEKGAALAMTLIVMLVVSILGLIVLQVSVAETKFSVRDKNRIEAYYIAKSGVEATADWLSKAENNPEQIINRTSLLETFPGSNGEYYVEIIGDENNELIVIKGVGIVNGVSETASMTMLRDVDGTRTLQFDYVLYAGSYLFPHGGVIVDSTLKVGYGEFIKEPIPKGFPSGSNLVQVTLDYPDPVYPAESSSLGELEVTGTKTIDFTYPSYVSSITYDSISFNQNAKLIIQTGSGSGEVNLIADSIDLNASGSSLVILGDKRVNLFFKGSVTVSSDINRDRSPDKLLFLMTGTGAFRLNNNRNQEQFNAFVYAPDASFTSTGNSVMAGAIIFKNVEIGGNPYLNDYAYNPDTDGIKIKFGSRYLQGSWID